MAMSLDYIGKFVIMTVVIAIGIGIITTLQGDVEGNVPSIPGEENGDQQEAQVVTIEATNDDQMYQEIANLVKLCDERGKQRSTSFTCFVIVSEGGEFDFSTGDLSPYGIDPNPVTTYDDTTTLLLRYDLAEGEGGETVFSDPSS